jgi:hypothetical protein
VRPRYKAARRSSGCRCSQVKQDSVPARCGARLTKTATVVEQIAIADDDQRRARKREDGRARNAVACRTGRDARAQSAMWLACAVRKPTSHYPWTAYRMYAPMDLERRPMRWSRGGLCAQGLLHLSTVRSTSVDVSKGSWSPGRFGDGTATASDGVPRRRVCMLAVESSDRGCLRRCQFRRRGC